MATNRIRNDTLNTDSRLTILLDTSFILMMLEQKRDLDDEIRDLIKGPFRITAIDAVEKELHRIAKSGHSKIPVVANAAIELLRARKYPILMSQIETSDADNAILSFAMSYKGPIAIATVDRKLRSNLTHFGFRVIRPRRIRGLLMS